MKLVLITGFLGSGKTTFLTRLLESFKDTKVGVIINEFGEKGIDGTLVKSSGIGLIELNNGSIFCSCIKDNFIYALTEMTNYPLDYVIVEASGLSDPSNIKSILQAVNKLSEKEYDYVGAICLVDALYFIQQLDLLPAIRRQIQYSSAVIINKIDLQTPEEMEQIENRLVEINENINIYKTSYCNENIKDILENLRLNNRTSNESTNTRENRPKTLVLSSDSIINFSELKEFLEKINANTYRIKGFANTNNGLFQISSVNQQLKITPWTKTNENTEIVVISSVGIKIISLIVKSQKECSEDLKFDIKQ